MGAARKKCALGGVAFGWAGVERQAYKFSLGDIRGMGWRGVTRFTLAGPAAWPVGFDLRYFELTPGGYSSFEKHTTRTSSSPCAARAARWSGGPLLRWTRLISCRCLRTPRTGGSTKGASRLAFSARWTLTAIPRSRSAPRSGRFCVTTRPLPRTCFEFENERHSNVREEAWR